MNDPKWIGAVLQSPFAGFLARLALVSAFLYGGLTKLFDFPGAIAEQAHFGLQPAPLWACFAIAIEIGGSILILWGRLVWLGAGGIGVLTAIAAAVAQPFWALEGHARVTALNGFLERLGLIAGFFLVAALAHVRRRSPTEHSVKD